jgi:hypothetical protein
MVMLSALITAIVAFCLVSASSAASSGTYTNPVKDDGADPFVSSTTSVAKALTFADSSSRPMATTT